MHSTAKRSFCFHEGFTLVELMVGLAIGMLATVVIIQVMSVFDAQRRSTTGSADAQTNGAIALHTITRELQMAGYPLFPAADSPLECTTLTFGATGITSISPVTIVNGAVSDSITIRFGNSAMGGVPSQITATGPVTTGSTLGCSAGDITLVNTGSVCAMSSVTSVDTATTLTLQSNAGVSTSASLACLGAWNEITYAVNTATGNLERTAKVNSVTSAATPSVVGVVNLQAQYGISDSANSNVITQWVNASGAWAAPTVDLRKRIKSVRIAVVARNENMEPSAVTKACGSTDPAPLARLCAWEDVAGSPAPTVDLSADANWARYRYRVFETIVPLRNVIWSKDTL